MGAVLVRRGRVLALTALRLNRLKDSDDLLLETGARRSWMLPATRRTTPVSARPSRVAICTKPRFAGSTIWQDKLHAARHQSERRDQNPSAQIDV